MEGLHCGLHAACVLLCTRLALSCVRYFSPFSFGAAALLSAWAASPSGPVGRGGDGQHGVPLQLGLSLQCYLNTIRYFSARMSSSSSTVPKGQSLPVRLLS